MTRQQLELGDSGLSVTAIGLGGMPLSLAGRPDPEIATEVIRAFIEAGGDFIDTANVYCVDDDDTGHNERLISSSLDKLGLHKQVTIATKGGLYRPRGGWDVCATPENLRRSCEKSLQDLATDCIFLYQLHAPDPDVPLTDSVGELVRLKEDGKIRHIGLSNVNTDEIRTALELTPILSVQNKCNILQQKAFNNGVVELCAVKDITFIAHSPVGGHFGHKKLAQCKPLSHVARRHGISAYQAALAWLLRQGDHILPIPGASKPASIMSSMKTLEIDLDEEDLQLLQDIKNNQGDAEK